VTALVGVLIEINRQVVILETELADRFELHPDAEIIRSLPGLGMILGDRVLGEFGDDQTLYPDAKCRKNCAGASPVTWAWGRSHVVLARHARNKRPAAAGCAWEHRQKEAA
jgi:transposase